MFGGSGAVGGWLLPALQEANREVVALSRESKPSVSMGLSWLQGSLESAPSLDALIERGARFDVICCLGPLDAFAAWIERHPPAASTRVLALSSLSAEWKRNSPNAAERALARALADGERRVFEICAGHAALATVLRCGLIYGTGTDRSLSPLLRWARRRLLPWPRAAQGLRQPVHARDLARAVQKVAARPQLAQRMLALPGPESLSFRHMLQRSLAAEGLDKRLLPVPLPGVFAAASLLSRVQGRFGTGAATVRRLYLDQLSPCDDWALLGVPLDELWRLEATAGDQFQNR